MSINIDGTYTGYIYKITNLINQKCYIGQTTTTIEHRWGQHKTDYNNPNPMYKAFKKYGLENFKIEEVSRYTRDTKEKLINILNSKEIYYINKFHSLVSENGYNLSIGGDNRGIYNCFPIDVYDRNGNLLFQCSSAKETSRLLDGYDVSSILDCCKGKSVPIIDRIFRFFGDSFDKYSIDRKTTGVPVYQFDLNGNFISIYNSLKEASKSVDGTVSGLNNVLIGKNKTYKGFYWSKKKSFEYLPPVDTKKQVIQYDKNNNKLNEFSSISEAARFLNSNSRATIRRACEGKVDFALGFIWEYKKDKDAIAQD